MADPFCPSCGTEVDEDARFCPTCGRTLMLDEDAQPMAEREPETMAIPPAPAWPPPEPAAGPEPAPEPEPAAEPEPEPAVQEPAPEPEPGPAPAPAAAARANPPPPPPPPGPGAPGASTTPSGPAAELPITWPVTLSGWLIGAGSLAAALTLLVRLGNPINLVLFVALLAIAASVFLADRVPTIPNQRLAILVVLTVALGVALERAAFRIQGVESIFLIAMIVAAGGALLLELGRDRPVSPLGGPG